MASDTTVTIAGKTFEIAPPDAITVLRVARIVGKIGMRAEKEAASLGRALFAAVQAESGEDKAAGTQIDSAIWVILSILDEADLFKLGAALLQFSNEAEGVRWLERHGLPLSALTRALVLNMQQLDDVVEAITGFTGMLRGIRLSGMAAPLPDGGSSSSGQ